MFDDICLQLHETAVKKGFWSVLEDVTQEQTDIFITKQLMMIALPVFILLVSNIHFNHSEKQKFFLT